MSKEAPAFNPGDGSGRGTRPRAPVPLGTLPEAVQRRVIEEILACRAEELRLAYPGVLQVCAGNRTAWNEGHGRRELKEPLEACLIFVVDRKLGKDELEKQKKRRPVPSQVLMITTVKRRRRLVLVPTDVEPWAELQGARPDSAPGSIVTEFAGQPSGDGMLCCAIGPRPRPGRGPKPKRAISCRHVLTAEAMLHQPEFLPGTVCLAGDFEAGIATTTVQSGRLGDAAAQGKPSFDAQIAEVEDDRRLRASLGNVKLDPHPVATIEDIPDEYWVQTAGGPKSLRRDTVTVQQIPIGYPDGRGGTIDCVHEALIVSEIVGGVGPGDSGAAVTTTREGGRLIGMHIASNQGNRRAFAIPAWHLLDPTRYGLPATPAFKLVDVTSLPEAHVVAVLPPSPDDPHIGSLSREFETSTQDPGAVSGGVGDPGGRSYGIYQMTSRHMGRVGGTVKRFVSDPLFPWRDRFPAELAPGSDEFTAVWRQIAAEDADRFRKAQHDYIKRTHFDVLRASLRHAGFNLDGRSRTLRDVVWSTAVHMGPHTRICAKAVQECEATAPLATFTKANDQRLIEAIYAERFREGRGGKLAHFPGSSTNVQKGLRARHEKERTLALAMLAAE